MTLRSVLLGVTIVALPLAANAQAVNGLYIGAGAGINIMQNESVTGIIGPFGTVATPTNTNISTKVGPMGLSYLGWGFGNGLRAQLEFDYRYNGLSTFSGPGFSATVSGSEQKFGPMADVLYDFTTVSPFFIPYIGAGVGYQWIRLKSTGGGVSTTETKGAFAYQAIAGGAFPIASVPGMAVTAEYHFLGTTGDRSYPVSGVRLGNDYNHSILLGVRYNFGQTTTVVETQAATPAPAAAMARSYLVFFDWDKATLTDRARGIIRDAATNSTKVAYTKIDVNGYTDTSGTPTYNQGLSVRRAQAVAAELVKDGVPKGAIAISGFGDTHLLVPTGPGVREPQNRRVEIIIH